MSETEGKYGREMRDYSEISGRILGLAERVGFQSTSELHAISADLTPDRILEQMPAWRDQAEKIVLGTTGPDQFKAELGMLVMQAGLQLRAGFTEDAFDGLHDAKRYAENLGLNELVVTIEGIVSEIENK